MKKILSIIICLACIMHVSGQTSMKISNTLSNTTNSCNYGLPVVRSINGGSKIIVDYQGDWPEYMRSAFQYACEIWEEAMPTTIPIRVEAYMEDTADGENTLSEVEVQKMEVANPTSNVSVKSQIKSLIFNDLVYSTNHFYADSVDYSFFNEPDIIITYYKDNVDENCSFWLSNTCDSGKYDFVSVVLRDLARGFGIVWDTNLGKVGAQIVSSKLTPYQRYINNALSPYTSRAQALAKATKGSLTIKTEDNISYKLYAPSTWKQHTSLNYFFPESSKKITQLLSYTFGRESVIRNLNDGNMYWTFNSLLKWQDLNISTGAGQYEAHEANTSNVIDLNNGEIVVTNDGTSNNGGTTYETASTKHFAPKKAPINYNYNYYVERFSPKYMSDGWTVSLMKNDGSWDVVHYQPSGSSLDVNMGNIELGSLSDYAITCDNYLRCRVVYFDEYHNQLKEYYYLINCPPRKIAMKMDKLLPIDDEYMRDVVVGLRNLEGVTKIVVEQKDEGDILPYYYEVGDFKKGYFVATVDKELSSTFRIRAYNSKGSTWSDTYTIPALTPTSESLKPIYFMGDDAIKVVPQSSRFAELHVYKNYRIQRMSAYSNQPIIDGEMNEEGEINIGSLEGGTYILNVTDIRGGNHSMKFVK